MTRGSLWNLAGSGLPLVVALFTIPIVIRGLGVERFGALTLVWAFLGYFALFDLGLGRAVIRLVARRLAPGGPEEDTHGLIGTALAVSVVLGLAGMLIMLAAGHVALASQVLQGAEGLQRELRISLVIVATLLPVVTATSVLNGVLEGHQQFRTVNLIRIPAGVLNYLIPVVVLQFSSELPAVVAATGALRVAVAGAFFAACRGLNGAGPVVSRPSRTWLRPLLSFGGWLTVSNVVGPLMVYLDRFVIAAVVSLSVTAYYTTPFEIVTKLWIIPAALAATLFPAFARSLTESAAAVESLFVGGTWTMFVFVTPVVVAVAALAHEGLQLWLGAEFAQQSTIVAQVLAVGILLNAMAFVPMALVQGAGRADLSAKLHLIELPPYLLVLWLLVEQYGIIGAAVAWAIRAAADAIALFWLSGRFLSSARAPALGLLLGAIGASAAILASGLEHVWQRVAFASTVAGAVVVLGWVRLGWSRQLSR